MSLLIKNASIITMNSSGDVLNDAAVYIEGNLVKALGSNEEVTASYSDTADKIIDARGKYIFPGFINTHVHSYQNLLKGMGTDLCFADWFMQVASPAGAMLDSRAFGVAAKACSIESIQSGVTTIMDMTPTPDGDKKVALIDAFEEVGIRANVGYGYASLEQQDCYQWLRGEIKDTLDYCIGKMTGVSLTPFQTWNNSREMLEATAAVADEFGLPVITHCLETDFDNEECIRVHGQGEIETLAKTGLLKDNLIIVHGVTITDEQIQMICRSGASVSYSPVCNMYLASGFAPVKEMLDAGMLVSISTEGAGCNNSVDFIETLKSAILVQKARTKDPSALSAYRALQMSTIDAAKAIGREDELGSIEEGKLADLFIFNPSLCAKAVPCIDPVSTLAYASDCSNIETVVVNGRIVMENREFTTCDVAAIYSDAQSISEGISEKLSN